MRKHQFVRSNLLMFARKVQFVVLMFDCAFSVILRLSCICAGAVRIEASIITAVASPLESDGWAAGLGLGLRLHLSIMVYLVGLHAC